MIPGRPKFTAGQRLQARLYLMPITGPPASKGGRTHMRRNLAFPRRTPSGALTAKPRQPFQLVPPKREKPKKPDFRVERAQRKREKAMVFRGSGRPTGGAIPGKEKKKPLKAKPGKQP